MRPWRWAGDGTDRSHLWPLCKTGDDDIYLMATIQYAMNEAGFWAGKGGGAAIL